MELFFESRTNLSEFRGHLNFIQTRPTVHPQPVLFPDTYADAKGLSIYGTVLRDGGRLRMWYLAIADDWDFQHDMSAVAYAESTDGIEWTKPKLGIVDHGPEPNNLTDLGLHCHSIWIDPNASSDRQYRATGCGYTELFMGNPNVTRLGYYTATSADGFRWSLDDTEPRWNSADVITSVYHPARKTGVVAMKFTPRVGRILRRSIHTAEMLGDHYTDAVSALYPDEFDDVCAAQRGHHSGDYYGMGMLPAGCGTVGFLWNYWHDLPYTGEHHIALFGTSDVTLVWQGERGGMWHHVPGRANFIDHSSCEWMDGWINTSSSPVEVGDEHWLYFSGQRSSHGFSFESNWTANEKWSQWAARNGRGAIGIARWPKWRLFGYESDPAGSFILDLGQVKAGSELRLNYRCKPDGAFKVFKLDAHGENSGSPAILEGDDLAGVVRWTDGPLQAEASVLPVKLRLELEVAAVYAYEVVPTGSPAR